MAKQKVIYKEVYKGHGLPTEVPRLRNINKNFIEESATIKEMGALEIDGERREYQIIRVVLKETVVGND